MVRYKDLTENQWPSCQIKKKKNLEDVQKAWRAIAQDMKKGFLFSSFLEKNLVGWYNSETTEVVWHYGAFFLRDICFILRFLHVTVNFPSIWTSTWD